MDLTSVSTIREIRDKYNFSLAKNLGQNFITDRNIIEKIAEGAEIGPEDLVIEIGPGIGVLTAEAAEAAARVCAIEIDRRLIPVLSETLADYGNIEIINRDILRTDLNEVIEDQRQRHGITGKIHVIGNLPYYITTPIIMKILEEGVPAGSITVMMQKEVADRICASAGSRTYGAISAVVQYYCKVEKIATVPRTVFVPQPKVDSAVLNLRPLKEKEIRLADEKIFFRCVRAGFAQRRKTLLNSISSSTGTDKEKVKEILEKAGIDPARRAETLTVEEFGRLANEVADERAD